jgi:hypothetical protein
MALYSMHGNFYSKNESSCIQHMQLLQCAFIHTIFSTLDALECSLQRNSIYVFPEKELRDLSPNFHNHVSVSDLYIPPIGPPFLLQQNMRADRGNI